MSAGVFYGIGIGPGDPDLITVKAVKILSTCPVVFVPKTGKGEESTAHTIAAAHLSPAAEIRELVFPMTTDPATLESFWRDNARQVAAVLEKGRDAAFLTLGDAMLYSTFIYLAEALQAVLPQAAIVTVPGITAFSAAAALTRFAVGVGKQPVTIVPTSDDLEELRRLLALPGTKVLMKIGRRLEAILAILDELGLLEGSVLVSRAGMSEQQIVTDLRTLRGQESRIGYLAVMLVSGTTGEEQV